MSRIACLFPGQGSQSVGMGRDLFAQSYAARRTFEEADRILGFALSALCFEGPDDLLRATLNTQPALFVTSVAAWRALAETRIAKPEAVAGHSIGEYAALYAAGALDFETGLKLVLRRAQELQRAAERAPGNMAAILGLDAQTVIEMCHDVEASGLGMLQPANFNGAGQVVVSGTPESIAAVSEEAKKRGAKRVMPLSVSGAFHSRAMKPAADAIAEVLKSADLHDPEIPVLANVTADYERTAREIRENLSAQIDHSVRWEESMLRLRAEGIDVFVEVGPGKVLAGIAKRMFPEALSMSVGDAAGIEALTAALSSR